MKRYLIHSHILLTGCVLATCIEPYQPKISEDYPDLLVIDGTVDASNNKVEVDLSHAMALDNITGPQKETGAQILLEKQNGDAIPLTETETGHYEATDLDIDYTASYRLTVRPRTGKSYRSDYIQIVKTPSIDNISWRPTDDGITIYANTHATPEAPSTGYYLWNFIETWEYTSMYYSYLIMENGVVRERTQAEDHYRCWKTIPSEQITIASSHKLSDDIISEFPLTSVPKNSYQLTNKYSIIVQQRSLTEEAYNYWLQLQKTTQSIGGLFDPLPAQVTGNFACISNPEETVLGFFSGSTVSEQRIFISIAELPRSLQGGSPYPNCPIDSVKTSDLAHYGTELSIISAYGAGPEPQGYLVTVRACIDCTLQGGITTKPDFWE